MVFRNVTKESKMAMQSSRLLVIVYPAYESYLTVARWSEPKLSVPRQVLIPSLPLAAQPQGDLHPLEDTIREYGPIAFPLLPTPALDR